MTPLARYEAALISGRYSADSAQLQVITQLEQTYLDFNHHQKNKNRLFQRFRRLKTPARGLYLWGGVGIGKTWLMDLFYESLPTSQKLRTHFHRFMRRIHQDLTALQGQADPLTVLAKRITKQTQILCFDEFFVSDITDAMLLGNLFSALFLEGVTVVATSNVAPDNLYRNGLQRERFLPAIALIKTHMTVLHMLSETDYRLRILDQVGTYLYPATLENEIKMQTAFDSVAQDQGRQGGALLIEGRSIETLALANEAVWFDFRKLCDVPRSQIDYLEIARLYTTVFLSHVEPIHQDDDRRICYLINLIDVFYDAHVKLMLLASVPIEALYSAGRFAFEFQRTRSRLLEMQTQTYLKKPHLG